MGEIKSTQSIAGTGNPQWDEWLEFGEGTWQYIEINIAKETGADLTKRQSFSVNPGNHSYQHTSGSKELTITIELTGYGCPCLMEDRVYTIPFVAVLKILMDHSVNILLDNSIIASHGENLPNKDTPSIDKTSDVFLKITAYDRQGKSRSLRTEVIRDNLNPIWNETIIDFGRRAWSWFKVEVGMTIQIYQDQIYNRLSAACKYNLTSFTPMMEERVNCYRGYVAFILAISEKNCSPLYY